MNASKAEQYSKWVWKLRERSESGVPIIVEGKRDESKLRELGISGPILKIQGKRVVQWVEALPPKFIVMTDFDPQGARYAGQIKRAGERNGKKVDTSFRVRIFSNTFARRVEELSLPELPFPELSLPKDPTDNSL